MTECQRGALMEAAAGRWRGSGAEGQRFPESSPDVGEVKAQKKKRGRRSPVDPPPGDNPLKAVSWRGLAPRRTWLRTLLRLQMRNGAQVFVGRLHHKGAAWNSPRTTGVRPPPPQSQSAASIALMLLHVCTEDSFRTNV